MGSIVKYASERTGLTQEYVWKFATLMFHKGMLEAIPAGKVRGYRTTSGSTPQHMELALTKVACDKVREMNATQVGAEDETEVPFSDDGRDTPTY
jgi:hypothetical protein